MQTLQKEDINVLITHLSKSGYSVIAPTIRDEVIVCDEVTSADQLPRGWKDLQSAGRYSLERREDDAFFGFTLPVQAWRRFLLPPRHRLFEMQKENGSWTTSDADSHPRYAFFGVRPCELSAMQIADKVYLGGEWEDRAYKMRRSNAFIVAVNCCWPGKNCFCPSMGTGPRATAGYDLLLTEMIGEKHHYFCLEVGSEKGASIIESVPGREASGEDRERLNVAMLRSEQSISKSIDTDNLPDLISRNLEHKSWEDVAKRCLACANCTMVCPTCFCTTVEDVTSLSGDRAERWRLWDSCFVSSFSKVAGGNFRPSVKSRYRQWMSHKLSTWVDQFGVMGCVGCGRCITWCPVGIDITEQASLLRTQTHADAKHAL